MESIKVYKPTNSSVSQARVLLIGAVGAGKSSFFNSVNSVFRGHVTSQAIAGSFSTSLTTQVSLCLLVASHMCWRMMSDGPDPLLLLWTPQFRTYSLKAGREGKPLPIILCDTMGLEEGKGAGLDLEDISSILKGHLPDCYQVSTDLCLGSYPHKTLAEVHLN